MRPKLIHSRAPLRICDIGGWTDTWFAGRGEVLNVAVGPPVEVQVKAGTLRAGRNDRVLILADNYRKRFRMDPDRPSRRLHPLLQFCVSTLPPPSGLEVEIRIFSPVPPGISTGTSASVAVALLGALAFLRGEARFARRAARLAHRVETEMLMLQSGIQDQICAAMGGVCHVRMERYPRARVSRLRLSPAAVSGLGRRLLLVYLGKPHSSSGLHERVITLLRRGGERLDILGRLAGLAGRARRHLEGGDLDAFGRVMAENNECQRDLFDKLISPEADEVIGLARRRRAAGWKVNGAGGRGGSLTLLTSADDGERRALLGDIGKLGRVIRVLPTVLSPSGLTVWRSP